MGNKYCKASVTGFSLTMMSVLIGHFFIFNDAMIHVLGREVFDAVYNPLLISLFLLPVAGFVLAIIGLKKCIREKLKGKGLSIAAVVIFVVVLTVTILCFGLVLLIAIGEGSFHKH
jgi:succinate dehydrogenase hydrophobic anchor subunit